MNGEAHVVDRANESCWAPRNPSFTNKVRLMEQNVYTSVKKPFFELFVTLVYTFFIAKSGRDIVPPA